MDNTRTCTVTDIFRTSDGCATHSLTDTHYPPPPVRRHPSDTESTDTEDTDDDRVVGGLGKYSHGVFNLVHQHYPVHCENAGGFNVDDTESPEAYHKTCMSLPAHRVRHYDTRTQDSMVKYGLHHLLFNTLNDIMFPALPRVRSPAKPGVYKPLYFMVGGSRQELRMGDDLTTFRMQTRILHHEVRLARGELLDLTCRKLGLPLCLSSYKTLQLLDWTFGQKLVTSEYKVYWATDTQYSTSFEKVNRRRDTLLLSQTEMVDVMLPNGDMVPRVTALCCQAICFLSLGNMSSLTEDDACRTPLNVLKEIVDDTLSLVLVRWFSPHPHSTERDCDYLPLCPPPLNINHALWQYAVTDCVRPILFDDDSTPSAAYQDQFYMFGRSRKQSLERLQAESRAYYDLILVSRIKCKTFMCPEFELNTVVEGKTWLQTISII